MEPPKNKTYKVIVIGDAGVGKTCLTYRYCENKFLENTSVTIGVDFRRKVLNIDGDIITLNLWDTAGLERNRGSMVQHYYRNAHAVIFVYDVTNYKSFSNLKCWIEECDKYIEENALKLIVGNKCDEPAAVNLNEAQLFADQNNMPLFETSAKTTNGNTIDGIFLTVAHKLKNQKPLMKPNELLAIESPPQPKSRCC